MAASAKKPKSRAKPLKTELSQLLTEYLLKIGRDKTEIAGTMEPLRDAPRGKEAPQGKYFYKVTGGSITPDFDYLLEVVAAIKVKAGRELTLSEVALWLATWLKDYLRKYPKPPKEDSQSTKQTALRRKAMDSFVKKAVSSAGQWQRTLDAGRGVNRDRPPTLRRKDYILNNCVVVVGAAVRLPPTSTEQLFRHNAHLSDLMYLPHLDLGRDPLLLTDNMVIALPESERKALLGGKHLLVIGGPAVNVATRYLNNRSVFPFCFDEQKRKFDEVFDTLKGLPSLRNSQAVEQFYEMLKKPASEVVLDVSPFIGKHVAEIRDDVEEFRRRFDLDEDTVYEDILGWLTGVHSLFDPIAGRVRTAHREPNLGVVSLGKNHWADDPHYVCVTVAGLNPYGTVCALRALVYSAFNDHPCGGVLNAVLPRASSEYLRLTDADFGWVTDKYAVADLKARLPKIRKDNRKDRPAYQAFYGEEHYFEEYAEFVGLFES